MWALYKGEELNFNDGYVLKTNQIYSIVIDKTDPNIDIVCIHEVDFIHHKIPYNRNAWKDQWLIGNSSDSDLSVLV